MLTALSMVYIFAGAVNIFNQGFYDNKDTKASLSVLQKRGSRLD
jgi:hypothetical protein